MEPPSSSKGEPPRRSASQRTMSTLQSQNIEINSRDSSDEPRQSPSFLDRLRLSTRKGSKDEKLTDNNTKRVANEMKAARAESDTGVGKRTTSPVKILAPTPPQEASPKPTSKLASEEEKERRKKDRVSLLQPLKHSVLKETSDSRDSTERSLRDSSSSMSKKRHSLPNVPLDPTQKVSTPRDLLKLDPEHEKYRNKWMMPMEAKRVLAQLAQDTSIKLPARLAAVVEITELELLATHSVTFYSHFGKAWQVLQANIRREIRNAEGFGAVLRGNTLSSKMMTKYVKLAGGAAYLQETFIPLVQKNLEATWVWEQQINQRANQPPEEVAKNFAALTSATDEILDALLASLARLPPVIRIVSQWIQREVQARFTDVSPSRLSVTSFFFLRLICPSISAPESLGIKVQRTGNSSPALKNLVAISKIVQQLANGQLFKEESNLILNPYLESKRSVYEEIVKAVSEPIVPEPVEQVFPVSAEDLDKCVEFFHAMLLLHGQQVVQHIAQGQENAVAVAAPNKPELYKLTVRVNPSVWFRNVIYGETVLEFGYSSEIVRNPAIEHLMQFFACPPVAASMLKWRLTESVDDATKLLKAFLTFAPTTNPNFIAGISEWKVSIPPGPNGEPRTWDQWLDECKQENEPDWSKIESALRILVKTLMSGNLVMIRVLPLYSPPQMVWFTWEQFLEGAYA